MSKTLQQAVSLVLMCAWLSLAAQLGVLMGHRGLLPAADWVQALSDAKIGFLAAPSWLRITGASDGILYGATWLGAVMALVGVTGFGTRWLLLLQAPLYLGLSVAGGTFFSFQWDQLFVESAVLVALVSKQRPLALWLVRLLVFKLYFESGIAKAESHLHDWWDGSAMTHYYETAPLPSTMAFFMHHMPVAWHHLESWATLAIELVMPWLVFCGRRPRLVALAALTGFQVANWATANYGFFVPLTLALHLSLLDENDLDGARAWMRSRLRRPPPSENPPKRAIKLPLAIFTGIWLVISTAEALDDFALPSLAETLTPLRAVYGGFRLFNTYHLFGHITVERIEPELQTFDGTDWTTQCLRYQPCDVHGPLAQVAPHQPRVAFQMWFYGLAAARTPTWVRTLVDRVCEEPSTVESLFQKPLPSKPLAVRLIFSRSQFVSQRDQAGVLWSRTLLDKTSPALCKAGKVDGADP